MSNFVAEASVLIRPDTKGFAAALTTEVNAAIAAAQAAAKPIVVPIAPVAVGATAAGLTAAVSATTALTASQESAATATLATAKAAQIEGQFWAGTIPILGAATAANEALAASGSSAAAGAAAAAAGAKGGTAALLGMGSASGKLDAALLGLRTALGSAAVIGLGATALAAIALGKAFRSMIIATAQFEQELATFRVTTGATAAEMERVSDAAQRLGADVTLPAVSAADAAIAMTELAKAGLSVQDSIAGAAGVLQLATAAQISNAEASQIAANALNSFGLAGDQAVRVADDFANAANAAQGSISDFGLALRQSSAVAKQVGLSLEDTITLLSLFAKNGLSGSDAGTSLRVALIRLVAPTKAANAELKRLGIEVRDAAGNVRPDVFAQFGRATRDLTPAARDAAAALIFGQDAIRAVSIGAREGTQGLRLMQFQIDQQGTAAEVASARTEGLAGAFLAMQSNLQTLGINLGGLVAGPLTEFSQNLNDIISLVTEVTQQLGKIGRIKIPSITIDVGFKVSLPGGELGDLISKALGIGAVGAISPAGAAVLGGKQLFDAFKGAPEAQREIAGLTREIDALQKARISAEAAGRPGIADALTRQIENARQRLKELQAQAKVGVDIKPEFAPFMASLKKARDDLQTVRDVRASLHLDTRQVDTALAGVNQELALLNRIAGGTTADGLRRVSGGFEQVDASARSVKGSVQGVTFTFDALTKSANAAGAALQAASHGADVAQQTLEQVQAGVIPGGRAAEEAAIQAAIAAQQKIIDTAKVGSKKYRDALRAKAALMGQLKSLQEQDAADARKRANDAKSAADKAAKASADATQAFIDSFALGIQNLENKVTTAANKSIEAQIAANNALIAGYKKEIAAIKARIRTMHLHGQALKIARDAIRNINQIIFGIQNDIAQETAQRNEAIRQSRQAHLEAILAIAQTTTTATDDRKALNAIIAFDEAQIKRINAIKKKRKLTRDEQAELDGYKVDLAQRNQALRELNDANKTTLTEAQKLRQAEFAFLQTMQGFTSNLIGNLIPGGLTGGLVGGAATSASTRQISGGFEQPRGGPFTAGAPRAVSTPAPPSSGQSERQIDWLHKIWEELRRLNRSSDHPEAKHQRRVGAAIADTAGNTHGM